MNTLAQWLDYIESLHPQHIEMGLQRIEGVAKRLRLLEFDAPVIVVGGTNGKGSCVATIESLAKVSGLSTAAYTSPHLLRFNERLRFNQQELSDENWVEALEIIENAREDTQLTYFEFTTLAALWLIKQLGPEIIVLEVGLGGRLDAVNMVNNDVAIITSIGMDHEDWLGNTLDAIAKEKAGIARPGKPVLLCGEEVASLVMPYLPDDSQAMNVNDAWRLEGEFLQPLDAAVEKHASRLYPDSVRAATVALKSLNVAISKDNFATALEQAVLPGRWEQLSSEPDLWLDVAHNPQAVANLAQKVRATGKRRWIFICAMLKDKKSTESLAHLTSIEGTWYFADSQGPRGMTGQELLDRCSSDLSNKYVISDIETELPGIIRDCEKDCGIVVFGSFYIVSTVSEWFKDKTL
ncbi:bifunctional folylpolyglutamate synthase/dihydrofolate synthase [Pleionea litopenaei]|uniref:Dihydrofolate synthase/folylpolyglutamate synthase n=1 Tax=Pleionea litopenaei TaxID=3070815 RepID=A0AA51RUG2_9GAMM|nr:folylpolyglutamate synthase/dihydrofolate synthase family protein [Pleionea sp. HL-JVS1]WMS87703.1 folylpolyglutamate synthase/dihydrofolate synthase family protein [Pleionea sp. HL-JVS1]